MPQSEQKIRTQVRRTEARSFDYYTIFTDVIRQWVTIVCIVAAVGLLTYAWRSFQYSPVYETRATLAVSGGGLGANVYSNISSADDTANKFETILNSNTLQKLVAQEAGMDSFSGSASASVVENTNLMTLKVDAGSPSLSFKEMEAILEHYPSVSEKLLGNVILETIEAPEIPDEPLNPFNPAGSIRNSMLIALVVMILIFIWISVRKDTIRTSSDVESKLMTHCLASVSHEKKYKTRKARKQKTSIIITNPTVTFRYVETMHRLARRVIERMDKKRAKTLLVTSVLENEGKTTVAANLALAMAEEHKRVLLIDGDFRKPSVHLVMGYQDKEWVSFSDVLEGKNPEGDFIQKIPNTNLNCIFNEKAVQGSSEMIASDAMRKAVRLFRDSYDYVIIDTPPMAIASDAEEFVHLTDASLIVVRQHLAESKSINDAIDVLDEDGRRVIGCVFNNVHSGNILRGYGYGRYRRYGYGSYGKYGYGGYGKYGYGQYGRYGRTKEEAGENDGSVSR